MKTTVTMVTKATKCSRRASLRKQGPNVYFNIITIIIIIIFFFFFWIQEIEELKEISENKTAKKSTSPSLNV